MLCTQPPPNLLVLRASRLLEQQRNIVINWPSHTTPPLSLDQLAILEAIRQTGQDCFRLELRRRGFPWQANAITTSIEQIRQHYQMCDLRQIVAEAVSRGDLPKLSSRRPQCDGTSWHQRMVFSLPHGYNPTATIIPIGIRTLVSRVHRVPQTEIERSRLKQTRQSLNVTRTAGAFTRAIVLGLIRPEPLPPPEVRLSYREAEVLALWAAGLNQAEIGSILRRSVNTIKTHLRQGRAKLSTIDPTADPTLLGFRSGLFVTGRHSARLVQAGIPSPA